MPEYRFIVYSRRTGTEIFAWFSGSIKETDITEHGHTYAPCHIIIDQLNGAGGYNHISTRDFAE